MQQYISNLLLTGEKKKGWNLKMKKIYKCNECDTTITIESEAHDLGDSITCPCDKEMFWLAKDI